jgi:hypothetical protein
MDLVAIANHSPIDHGSDEELGSNHLIRALRGQALTYCQRVLQPALEFSKLRARHLAAGY